VIAARGEQAPSLSPITSPRCLTPIYLHDNASNRFPDSDSNFSPDNASTPFPDNGQRAITPTPSPSERQTTSRRSPIERSIRRSRTPYDRPSGRIPTTPPPPTAVHSQTREADRETRQRIANMLRQSRKRHVGTSKTTLEIEEQEEMEVLSENVRGPEII
jgi:hypothetical protein